MSNSQQHSWVMEVPFVVAFGWHPTIVFRHLNGDSVAGAALPTIALVAGIAEAILAPESAAASPAGGD